MRMSLKSRIGQKLLQKGTKTLSHGVEDTSDSTLWVLVLEVKPPAYFDQKE